MRFSVDDPETDQEVAEKAYFGFWKEYGSADTLRRGLATGSDLVLLPRSLPTAEALRGV